MWKTVLAGAAAVAIAGCSSVYAQDRAANAPTGLDSPRGWQPSADDISGHCHVNQKFADQMTMAVTVHAATVAWRHVSIA